MTTDETMEDIMLDLSSKMDDLHAAYDFETEGEGLCAGLNMKQLEHVVENAEHVASETAAMARELRACFNGRKMKADVRAAEREVPND